MYGYYDVYFTEIIFLLQDTPNETDNDYLHQLRNIY